jgi:hypothetical protein
MGRMIQGVGLPPQLAFYQGPGSSATLPVIGVPAAWFVDYVNEIRVIRRSYIPGYEQAAPALNAVLHAIIANPSDEPDQLRDHFYTLHHMLTGIHSM